MDGAFFLGFLLLLFLIFLAIGRYHPVSGAEVLDWKPTRSPEVEAELELDDVDQMLEAQNERRRRTGRPELTEEQVAARVAEDERWKKDLLDRYRRESEGDVEA
jgi:ribosomal protein L21